MTSALRGSTSGPKRTATRARLHNGAAPLADPKILLWAGISLSAGTSFDVELSIGFLSLPRDWLRPVDRVHAAGLKAKPELGIQFGAGGDTEIAELETALATLAASSMARKFVDGGVEDDD